MTLGRGTCNVCGGRVSYRDFYNGSYWVHDETGHYAKVLDGVRHDCNGNVLTDDGEER